MRDRERQVGARPRREQLGDVEGVAAGDGVGLAGIAACERGHGLLRQRLELHEHEVVRTCRAERRVQRMAERQLAVAAREHHERRQRPDPAHEDRDRIERRVVRPVHVLDHEHRRPGRQPQLLDQEPVDLVRGVAGGERALELGRDMAGQVSQRAERPRDREIVAAPEEHPGAVVEVGQEAGDDGGLADAGLADDDDHATLAPRRRVTRLGERGERTVALEQLHRGNDRPALILRQRTVCRA